ncbi:TPA: hypothetical protein I7117_15320 [Vibrio vulnificus]|uniref:TcpQ domain-containing protein n=1 Tax=Vibrio TaxID=662 RepID=UPI0018DEB0FD|nr:TcpQ domain-containing protein [Vibrio navarrensis]EHA1126469.1 hypothetical protein [Vibrio navarrensis]MBH9740035.1 hypothetical protein [Vibrio navarrensis]HAS6100830.1 hypothetical protein [Vibrio vulnificus]HDY8121378.1 TcpQ domain-containing protein [Vibrio vulnificus]
MRPNLKASIGLLLLASMNSYGAIYFSDTSGSSDVSQRETSIISSSQSAHLIGLVNALVPSDWIVNVGPGLSGTYVVWGRSNNWQNALELIQQNNSNVYIGINESQKVVAVANTREQIIYLKSRNPKVWTVDPKLTLKENLTKWGRQNNTEIVWKSIWDFPVLSQTTLMGELGGEGGVLDRVLQETAHSESPLKVGRSEEISTFIISDGGKKVGNKK